MNQMNTFLAQYYNNGSPETEKTASEEETNMALFCKIAADQGVDLEKLSDEQIDALYERTFAKEAEMAPPFGKKDDDGDKDEKKDDKAPPFAKKEDGDKKDDKDEEKKAAASAEWQEKKAAQEKVAEADFLGRVMAHAYVNEMRKIAESAAETPAAEPTEKAAETEETPSDGSAFEEVALKHAFAIVQHHNSTQPAEQQYDEKVAESRLIAVYTLGLQESTKVASANSPEEGINTRALEYLAAAGYPVAA